MHRASSIAALVVLASSLPVLTQDNATALCGGDQSAPQALARRLGPLAGAAAALARLVESTAPADRLCGIVGLAVLDDSRAVPLLIGALADPPMRDDAYQIARAAAYRVAAPDPVDGDQLQRLVAAATQPEVRAAAGDDGVWLLGEIEHSAARDALLAQLGSSDDAATVDAVVHALARQGEGRARDRIAALGADALAAKSGNATPEQARRLAAVAFYQLALGPESLSDGLATLSTFAVRDQQTAASWAIHTLCARAIRRPEQRETLGSHRAVLAAELDRLGVDWRAPQGRLGCTP